MYFSTTTAAFSLCTLCGGFGSASGRTRCTTGTRNTTQTCVHRLHHRLPPKSPTNTNSPTNDQRQHRSHRQPGQPAHCFTVNGSILLAENSIQKLSQRTHTHTQRTTQRTHANKYTTHHKHHKHQCNQCTNTNDDDDGDDDITSNTNNYSTPTTIRHQRLQHGIACVTTTNNDCQHAQCNALQRRHQTTTCS